MTNTQPYADLEIRILERQGAGYPVEITLNGDQHFPRGFLAADLLPWISTGDPRADGEHLFTTLIADASLREAWARARGQHPQRRVRLRLDTTAPELHALPWELLHDGLTFITADAATPFSRYLPGDMPWGGLVAERPIRVLIMIANPADLDQYGLTSLVVKTECALLSEALDDLTPTHFCLEYLEAPVTPERLERALASGPHILHFVGHGAFSERRQEAVLYLQDDSGNAQIVTDAQLCDMLRRQGTLPRLIFLAACQSAERSTVDVFAGLAPKLVQAGVPAVVAMQDKVAIAATHKLTPVFYEELARHGEVDRALNAARSLLLTGQAPDAATPVLLMRMKDEQLWEPLWAKTNPYRGLAAFTEDEATFFFGREQLIEELLAHLRSAPRFLVVVGSSGSGKSSVVQAGLIPALRKGGLPGSQSWQIVTFRPGNDPYAALREVKVDLPGIRKSAKSESRLLLYADQFEELFALCSETVQQQFLDDLLTLIESAPPVTVILTVRADFYGHLLRHALGERIKEAQVNVLPMKPEDLRAAIEEPARKAGLRFEAGLVETIIQGTIASAHVLPLLQSALTQLWHKQMQGMLTYDAYKAIGGVAGAISVWADDAYSGLSAQEQPLARRVLTRLVHYGEGGAADTGQRQALTDLVTEPGEQDALRQLVKKLADARLVVTGEGETVEIIHDALLREWARLKQWITEQREFYLWRQRLNTQLQMWKAQEEDEGALLRGALLAEAERWLEELPEELNSNEQAYITQGLALQQQEQAAREKQQRNLKTALVVTLLLFLAAAGAAWIAMRQTDLAKQRLGEARSAESTAVDEAHIRATAQAEAEAERDRAETQAQIALARQLKVKAQQVFAQQSSLWQLEEAVLLAVESLRRYPEREANSVLTSAVPTLVGRVSQIEFRGRIPAFDVSPGGEWIVSVECEEYYSNSGGLICETSSIKIWEVATGYEVAEIMYQGNTTSVNFSPDGQWVLSAGCDEYTNYSCSRGSAWVWEAATGQEITHVTHERQINNVAFSPDGQWVVSAGCDEHPSYWCTRSSARVWEAATGREVARVSHEGIINAVTFSPDGQRVVLGSDDGTVQVWEATTGREVMRVTHRDSINAVTFSPDGQRVVSGSDDGTAQVWEAATGRHRAQMTHEDSVRTVAFSPDGQWVVSGSDDGTARVWESETGLEIARMMHESAVRVVAFDPDGRWVVSGAVSGLTQNSGTVSARIWEVATGDEIGRETYVREVYGVAFGPHGDWVVTNGCDEVYTNFGQIYCRVSSVRVWKPAPGHILVQAKYRSRVDSVAFSPDGRYAIFGVYNGLAEIWNIRSGRIVTSTEQYCCVQAVDFSQDGQHVISAGCDRGDPDGSCYASSARVWEIETGQEIARGIHTGMLTTAAFSPDGQMVVSGSQDGIVRTWEAGTGREVAQMMHNDWVYAVAFSPDGIWIASGGDDDTARVWEAATGREVARVMHEGGVKSVAFSPDGRWVVSGSWDGTARVWETKTGQEVARVTHKHSVDAVAFSPDGRWVISAGCDEILGSSGCIRGSAQVWEAQTGRQIMQMTHEDSVVAVAFSPNGVWVASGSDDGMVLIWEATSGREVARELHGDAVTAIAFSPNGRLVMSAGCDKSEFGWKCLNGSAKIWLWHPDDLVDLACSRLTRNLTREEWWLYLGNEPYRATCPNLPIPEN